MSHFLFLSTLAVCCEHTGLAFSVKTNGFSPLLFHSLYRLHFVSPLLLLSLSICFSTSSLVYFFCLFSVKSILLCCILPSSLLSPLSYFSQFTLLLFIFMPQLFLSLSEPYLISLCIINRFLSTLVYDPLLYST